MNRSASSAVTRVRSIGWKVPLATCQTLRGLPSKAIRIANREASTSGSVSDGSLNASITCVSAPYSRSTRSRVSLGSDASEPPPSRSR